MLQSDPHVPSSHLCFFSLAIFSLSFVFFHLFSVCLCISLFFLLLSIPSSLSFFVGSILTPLSVRAQTSLSRAALSHRDPNLLVSLLVPMLPHWLLLSVPACPPACWSACLPACCLTDYHLSSPAYLILLLCPTASLSLCVSCLSLCVCVLPLSLCVCVASLCVCVCLACLCVCVWLESVCVCLLSLWLCVYVPYLCRCAYHSCHCCGFSSFSRLLATHSL